MRILLNHFGWDKEKLLEAYYDTDQEQLFREARVINPNITRSQNPIPTKGHEDCEICYLQKPSSVSLTQFSSIAWLTVGLGEVSFLTELALHE